MQLLILRLFSWLALFKFLHACGSSGALVKMQHQLGEPGWSPGFCVSNQLQEEALQTALDYEILGAQAIITGTRSGFTK